MSRGERLGKRGGNLDNALHGATSLGDQTLKGMPLDEFHGEKVDAVGFLDREHRNDVRVVEGSDRASLAEARQTLGIVRHLGGKHLEGHVAAELGIGGTVHLSHAACADRGCNPIPLEYGVQVAHGIEPSSSYELDIAA